MIDSNAILQINTKNLIKNFKSIKKIAKTSICGATIKANAYGLGDKKIYDTLYKNGCRHFFLATLQEALSIRNYSKKSYLYVLNGLESNNLDIFYKFNIIPILVSKEEINLFLKSKYLYKKFKIGIQIETGLNRLGVNIDDLKINLIKKIDTLILISHLASAEEFNNKFSNKQNMKFKTIFNNFKSIKYKSLSNSAGLVNNSFFHYDILRPGIALYGGYDNNKIKKIMKPKPVVKLKAKVLQIKYVNKNEFIGYNQTFKTRKKIKIAILGIGYADGFPRSLSNKGKVYFKKKIFEILGRVSMDSITINITNSKYKIKNGDYMDLINNKYDIERFSRLCGTINREILTSFSKRVKRIYI